MRRLSILVLTASLSLLALGCQGAPAEQPVATPLVSAASASHSMAALDPATVEYKLLALIDGFENIPSEQDLAAIGPAEVVGPALLAIVEDPSVPLYKRVQGVAALRFLPSDAVKVAMESFMLDPDGEPLLRRSATKAYGVAFGVDAVAVLETLLSHPDVHTRDAAAQALALIDTPLTTGILTKHLAVEKAPSVTSTIKNALAK